MTKNVKPLKIEKTLDETHELLIAVVQELTYVSSSEIDHTLISMVNAAAELIQVSQKHWYENHYDENDE